MTTGDWLGLICLAGIVGFFAGGFFVWNLFFKRDVPDHEESAEGESEETGLSPPANGTGDGDETGEGA